MPVGPLIVPPSVRPWGSEIVGQPAAAVTKVLVGVGVGVGAGVVVVLLIVTFPLVPAEAISPAPQPLRINALLPSRSKPWNFLTIVPLGRSGRHPIRLRLSCV